MKRQKLFSLILILGLLSFLSGCTIAKGQERPSLFDESQGIIAQGVIEAKEVSINSKIPGKIVKLHMEEGQEVKAGALLVEVSSDELRAKEAQAKALIEAAKASMDAAQGQVDAANSQLEKAQNGAREQELAQAQAYCDLMEKTYERVENLFEKGAVSAQKRDEVATQLEVARQQLSLAQEGARVEDKSGAQALVVQAMSMKEAAKGKLEQAQGGLQEVQAYLKDTKITAPIDGTVTLVNADEGELVSSGMSIAAITDLNSTWVEVKVKETDLSKISIDQQVDVKLLGYPDELFTGKVVRINGKPDFATKRSTNDNGDFDILSYGVKIQLENQNKTFRPGMTAFVQFK